MLPSKLSTVNTRREYTYWVIFSSHNWIKQLFECSVVKSLFDLVGRFFIKKCTSYDWPNWSLGWSFIIGNITESDEIPWPRTFSYQSIPWKVLHACLFSFKVRESNVSFELLHIFSQLQIFYHKLQSWLDLMTAIINERGIYQPGLKGFKATKLN